MKIRSVLSITAPSLVLCACAATDPNGPAAFPSDKGLADFSELSARWGVPSLAMERLARPKATSSGASIRKITLSTTIDRDGKSFASGALSLEFLPGREQFAIASYQFSSDSSQSTTKALDFNGLFSVLSSQHIHLTKSNIDTQSRTTLTSLKIPDNLESVFAPNTTWSYEYGRSTLIASIPAASPRPPAFDSESRQCTNSPLGSAANLHPSLRGATVIIRCSTVQGGSDTVLTLAHLVDYGVTLPVSRTTGSAVTGSVSTTYFVQSVDFGK